MPEHNTVICLDEDSAAQTLVDGLPRGLGNGREQPEIGLIGPAMHCVNAIPYVVRAEPGIKTYLDLPLIAGRAQ